MSALLLLASAAALQAQVPGSATNITAQRPDDAGKPYTLHVYSTLVQVPTLSLYYGLPEFQDKRPLTTTDFSITIDDGPAFHPTSMRLEGEDPISLAIVVDTSGDQKDLLRSFAHDLAQLAPAYLHPQDRVSLYAFDCKLLHSLDNAAPDAARLEAAMNELTTNADLHGGKQKPACANSLRIWDYLSFISARMGTSPSRRVMLVVSEGRDAKSSLSLSKAISYIGMQGVAVFGLRDRLIHETVWEFTLSHSRLHGGDDPDGLAALAGSMGGTVYNTVQPTLAATLQQWMKDLRGRYILEFTEPAGAKAGHHDIEVEIDRYKTAAHTAPVSGTLPDPALLNDPTTIPTAPSPAIMGNKPPPQQ